MELEIDDKQGWTEITIDRNCDNDKFYESAEILQNHFKIQFNSKLDDFDTFYWDFKYKGSDLTLYYNIYLGLSIHPKALKDASLTDNANSIEIAKLIFHQLKEK